LGVQESFFSFTGEPLLAAFKEGIGNEFTPVPEIAWKEFYRALSTNVARTVNTGKVGRFWRAGHCLSLQL
jgi:hemoglobin-like flavoprotein